MSRATCTAIDTRNKHNPTDMIQTEQTQTFRMDEETHRWWTTPKRGPLGWAFSPREEWLARRAMKSAAEYMQGYGKGRQPYEIDKSHYEQGLRPTTHDKP